MRKISRILVGFFYAFILFSVNAINVYAREISCNGRLAQKNVELLYKEFADDKMSALANFWFKIGKNPGKEFRNLSVFKDDEGRYEFGISNSEITFLFGDEKDWDKKDSFGAFFSYTAKAKTSKTEQLKCSLKRSKNTIRNP